MKKLVLVSILALSAGCSTLTHGTTQTISLEENVQPCVVMQGGELLAFNSTEFVAKRKKEAVIIDCQGDRRVLEPKPTKAALTGAALLDFGVVDLMTGAFWGFEDESK